MGDTSPLTGEPIAKEDRMTKTMTTVLIGITLLGGYGCQVAKPKPEMIEKEKYILLMADAAAAETLYLKCNKEADRLDREHEQLKREYKDLKYFIAGNTDATNEDLKYIIYDLRFPFPAGDPDAMQEWTLEFNRARGIK